jgi:ankyrin repeat protein
MFAARGGDVASAKLLVAAGADINDADAWGVSATVLAAHSGYGKLVEFLLESGADPNTAAAGFTALQEAVMRRDEQLVATLLAYGANPNTPLRTWTPTRRASRDFNFPPAFVGATPFWLAARFTEPNIMRLLVHHGADPLFVHQVDYMQRRRALATERRREATTALMAAVGMGGGTGVRAWLHPDHAESETWTLEAVKLATQLGVDVNAVDVDGRTALDAARVLKYGTVVEFLVEQGARSGTK